ncbi:hypothetical protein E2C01_007736 [Portunus trituberculatus]|uniref:Uncharacterized protein n=1 Tax=Portunus trituberculatus TaxID=210409 RepID=A0A5B7D366_PORTR|nr:hypothetical protein [Portunus trituberculatus]
MRCKGELVEIIYKSEDSKLPSDSSAATSRPPVSTARGGAEHGEEKYEWRECPAAKPRTGWQGCRLPPPCLPWRARSAAGAAWPGLRRPQVITFSTLLHLPLESRVNKVRAVNAWVSSVQVRHKALRCCGLGGRQLIIGNVCHRLVSRRAIKPRYFTCGVDFPPRRVIR